MTAESRELLRIALLRILDANNTRFGLSARGLHHALYTFGFGDTPPGDIVPELDYLRDKGLIATIDKVISPELRAWRITADGRDHLATNA